MFFGFTISIDLIYVDQQQVLFFDSSFYYEFRYAFELLIITITLLNVEVFHSLSLKGKVLVITQVTFFLGFLAAFNLISLSALFGYIEIPFTYHADYFWSIPFKSFFITFKIGVVNLMISTISIRFLPYFLYSRLEKIRPFLTNFLEKESLKTVFLFLVNGMYNSSFFILHFSAAQIQKGLTMVSQGVIIISPGLYWFFNRESLKDLELRTRKEEALIARKLTQNGLLQMKECEF